MKFSPEPFNLSNSMKWVDDQQQKELQAKTDDETTSQSDDQDEDEEDTLSLSSLSKFILPPLGVSSYNQNQTKSKWIISPMDSRYRCWETFMMMLVFYSEWIYPFEAAFFSSSPPRKPYIAYNIVDLFFSVDIVLTFFVAYIDPITQLLVRDSKMIAVRKGQPTGASHVAREDDRAHATSRYKRKAHQRRRGGFFFWIIFLLRFLSFCKRPLG
ncbi:hypothetical protein PTKIN_Ptkin02bG0189400 [Pterospermum kingtungense]